MLTSRSPSSRFRFPAITELSNSIYGLILASSGLKPFEIAPRMILAGLQQAVLFRLVNVEIGRANAKRVNIDGSVPVITVQMTHFLRIQRSFEKRLSVVEKILDLVGYLDVAVPEGCNFSFGIQPKSQCLAVVNIRASLCQCASQKSFVLRRIIFRFERSFATFSALNVLFTIEELYRIIVK